MLISENPHPSKEKFTSTAIALVGTGQFIEAATGNYKGFNQRHVYHQAFKILRIQYFQFYQWCLIRFCVQWPGSERLIPRKYFDITPDNFVPFHDEVKSYIQEPKFMWRFSLANYGYFAKTFGKYVPVYFSNNNFTARETLIWSVDDSPLLSYVNSYRDLFKLVFKETIKAHQNDHHRGIKMSKIKEIQDKFSFKLKEYQKYECFYSDDFYLHLLKGSFCVDDFVQTLITGHSSHGVGKLFLKSIELSNNELAIEKLQRKVKKQHKFHKKQPHDDDNDIYGKKMMTYYPETAACYLGTPGKHNNDELRFQHLKMFVETRKKKSKPSNKYHFSTDWCHEVIVSDPNFDRSQYAAALSDFGNVANVNNYFAYDANSKSRVRYGWKVPCNSRVEYEGFIQRHYDTFRTGSVGSKIYDSVNSRNSDTHSKRLVDRDLMNSDGLSVHSIVVQKNPSRVSSIKSNWVHDTNDDNNNNTSEKCNGVDNSINDNNKLKLIEKREQDNELNSSGLYDSQECSENSNDDVGYKTGPQDNSDRDVRKRRRSRFAVKKYVPKVDVKKVLI